jgi:hypothetical protein
MHGYKGSWARAELGHKEELNRADRWQDHTRLRLLRWDKKTSAIVHKV